MEAIGAILEGIFAIICFFVELCIYFLIALFRWGEKPNEGESQLSRKRLVAAFAPVATILGIALIVFVFILGISYFDSWRADVRRQREEARRQRVETTRTLVQTHANELELKVDEDGRFVRQPTEVLDTNDAWGNPLRIEYKDSMLHDSLTVRSDGEDEAPNTLDDLTARRRISLPKKEIAKNAFDKAKTAILDRFKKDD